jgi:16S rRNA C967 or C1407 C5-methylase (RsmB/RsmF family)/NOL1/NOP2/fmu family ribosome biogenesis protein
MAVLPQTLLDSLQGVAGFDEAAFQHVHQSGEQVTSIRVNPLKWPDENSNSLTEKFSVRHSPFSIRNVPWSRYGYYLAQRPSFTFDPLFHAGCYYVQEASSLFLEQALQQTTDLLQPLKVLDLCAAPGGKSTHIQSLISSDSLLVSNEVIRNRATVLKQNIIKWGGENVVVTNNDPQHFARLEGFFDVIVVDAPCSGSGLFRRDAEAINEWSLENVQLCCGRQKRILADVFPALKEGGILIYSTCSYSKEEDEDIADWLVKEQGMENIKLHVETAWQIIESQSEKTGTTGYRFFPYNVAGEGFYLAVFRKTTAANEPRLKEATLEHASAAEKNVAQKWLLPSSSRELFRTPHLYGLLKNFVRDYAVLKNYLRIVYAGVAIGEVLRNKLLPEHALALSRIVSSSVPSVAVDYDTAIRYLQRSDIFLETKPGWQLVCFSGHNIGWINALPNRINNYYPKEWRILKQHNDSGFEK